MDFNFNALKSTFKLLINKKIFTSQQMRIRLYLTLFLVSGDLVVSSMVPYYAKFVVNSFASTKNGTNISLSFLSILSMLGLLGFFWTLEKTITHCQDLIFFPIINKVIKDLTARVVLQIHNLPLLEYNKLSIPEVINSMRRISMGARSFMKVMILITCSTTIKLIVTCIITIKMTNWGWSLLPAIMLAGWLLYVGTRWYIAGRKAAWNISDKLIARVTDSLFNSKIVRPYQAFEVQELDQLLTIEARKWQITNNRLQMIYIMINLCLGLSFTIILIAVALAIKAGDLSIGDLVFLKGQLLAVCMPFRMFVTEFRQVAEAVIDLGKILQILELPINQKLNLTYLKFTKAEQIVKLDRVTFTYPELEQPILQNISGAISLGEQIAIIGDSGSGKSTLLNLLAGFYKPNKGSIYLNKINITNNSDLAKFKIHYVPQDFRLFNASLDYNLTYGIADPSARQLQEVLGSLQLLPLIESLPLGLNTMVGELGNKLSGGERQKIMLARALLLNPDLLLLDEVTSYLDLNTEKAILKMLIATIPTVVLVSHRYAALNNLGLTKIWKIASANLTEYKHFSRSDQAILLP